MPSRECPCDEGWGPSERRELGRVTSRTNGKRRGRLTPRATIVSALVAPRNKGERRGPAAPQRKGRSSAALPPYLPSPLFLRGARDGVAPGLPCGARGPGAHGRTSGYRGKGRNTGSTTTGPWPPGRPGYLVLRAPRRATLSFKGPASRPSGRTRDVHWRGERGQSTRSVRCERPVCWARAWSRSGYRVVGLPAGGYGCFTRRGVCVCGPGVCDER
jgi:hypothetical protein